MKIRANGKEITVSNVYSETLRRDGKTYPALRIVVDGGLSAADMKALCSGSLEILDDEGNVVGTHEGYTTASEHSFVIGRITTAEQEIAELENEITAANEVHAEYVATVQTILPVLDDAEAVTVKTLYPAWEPDKAYTAGERLRYSDVLYKVLQDHTSQADWLPSDTAALYTAIDETHAGTAEDPIPYNGNMALENGLYYVQDGVVYLCTRDTETPVYHALSDLVGQYVAIYEA